MKFHPKPIIYGIGLLLLQHSVYALAGFEDDVLGVKKLPIASKAKAVNRYTGSTGSRRSIVDAADVDINNNNNNNGDTFSAISTNGFQSDVLGVHLPGTGTPITSNTSHHQSPRRRRLTSTDSIINALNDDVANGILKPSFTMVVDGIASAAGTGTVLVLTPVEEELDKQTLAVEALKLLLPMRPTSTTALRRRHLRLTSPWPIHPSPISSKLDEDGSTSRSGDFCILAVNSTAGSVEGIIKKNGWSLMNLESNLDESTVEDESVATKLVAREVVVEDREWACGVEEGGTSGGRMLHEDHDHEHHDHGHHDHSDSNFDFLSNLNANLGSKLGSNSKVQFSSRNLRSRGHDTSNTDSDSANRRLYATDNFPDLYSYQVDLYIEIDQGFVDNHGSMDAAITYVNVLVTAISSIYEEEIDTHLNVLHIALTTVYDTLAITNTQEAIDLMKATYANDTWHYTDGSHYPDLHHAFIFRSIGGGIASLEAVCSSQIGYGVSSGMVGSLAQAQSGAMYWDIYVVAHEIGHNFGAYHTHDANAWDPLIDSCGLNTCNGVSTGAATIMSYCHLCSGEVSNIALSFGGYWNEGDRNNIDNWTNDPGVVSFGTDPKRVAKSMWEFVSTRGTCVAPYGAVPSVSCSQNSDCHDGNACTVDTCLGTEQCTNTMLGGCCGNFVCEVDESGCSDCGPFQVVTPGCSLCYIPEGMMFDVEAVNDIILTSLNVQLYSGTNDVTVYTASRTYNDIKFTSASWTQVFTQSFAVSDWSLVSIDFNDIELSRGDIQAFYIATTGQVTATGDTTNPLANDENLKLLNPGRGVGSDAFGGGYSNVKSWVGNVLYDLPVPVITTSSPSKSTTASPITPDPTKASTAPTSSPTTSDPTVAPTSSPTTSDPTIAPTPPSLTNDPTINHQAPTSSPITSDPTVATTTTTSTISTTTTTSTLEPKFWPDWLGDDTCVFNEEFPQYMQLNPSWTGSTLEDCCKRYYSWRYDDCMVEGGGTSNTATLYYPNWEGSDHVCVNDGEAPAYITQAASAFMFEDLEDCCEKYYWWNMAECLGSAANAGSNKYYADYSQSKCVKDCTDSDCGGLVGGVWDELYDDKALCCAEKFWWVEDCNA
eukprot:g4797.t1 g4797   contig17:57986-65940(-)